MLGVFRQITSGGNFRNENSLMSVSLIVTGNNTEIPPHIAASIKRIFATGGSGAFYGVAINGVTFRKVIRWERSASLISNEGIWVDGKLIKRLGAGDDWYIGEVEAVQTVYTYDYEEAKKAWGKDEYMALY